MRCATACGVVAAGSIMTVHPGSPGFLPQCGGLSAILFALTRVPRLMMVAGNGCPGLHPAPDLRFGSNFSQLLRALDEIRVIGNAALRRTRYGFALLSGYSRFMTSAALSGGNDNTQEELSPVRQLATLDRGYPNMNWDRTIAKVAPYAAVVIAVLVTMYVFAGYMQMQ